MAQSITIKIADRPYSLKVTSPEQEELIKNGKPFSAILRLENGKVVFDFS